MQTSRPCIRGKWICLPFNKLRVQRLAINNNYKFYTLIIPHPVSFHAYFRWAESNKELMRKEVKKMVLLTALLLLLLHTAVVVHGQGERRTILIVFFEPG